MNRLLAGGLAALMTLSTASASLAYDPKGTAWSPPIQQRLDQLLARPDLKGALVVFDADGTLWRDDIGEAFARWLIAEKKLVPPQVADPFAEYERLCAIDKMVGYPYLVQIMAGIREQDLRAWADAFAKTHVAQHAYQPQHALIKALQAKGADVWIVSASNQWIVEAGGHYLGIPADKVVGIRLEVKDGILTDRVIPPVTYRPGKVEAIGKYIGKTPILVAGDSITDYEMMALSSDIALVIHPQEGGSGPKQLKALAEKHGWPIQHW